MINIKLILFYIFIYLYLLSEFIIIIESSFINISDNIILDEITVTKIIDPYLLPNGMIVDEITVTKITDPYILPNGMIVDEIIISESTNPNNFYINHNNHRSNIIDNKTFIESVIDYIRFMILLNL
jgi:hypothetical protein